MAKDSGPSTLILLVLAAAGLLTASARVSPFAKGAHPAHNVTPGSRKAAVGGSSAGWSADSPVQIPARGWWTVMKRVYTGFMDDRLMTEAAGVTFYTLLAIFPAIATLISLYGFFADPATVGQQVMSLQGVLPGGGIDLIQEQVKSLTANGRQALGLGVAIGVLTSLWSANQGIKGLFDALNVVYHEKEKRGYFARTLVCLAFTLGAIVFIMFAMASVVIVPIVLNFFGLNSDWTTWLLAELRWPFLMVVLGLFLAAVYRFGPSRTRAKWRWISGGSVFAVIAWVLASWGFSYYVAHFGSYNKTYGSLGAAIGFMTWIWISAMIVLLGGELNAELEQQTGRDTTVGARKPIGQRGAYKADVKLQAGR